MGTIAKVLSQWLLIGNPVQEIVQREQRFDKLKAFNSNIMPLNHLSNKNNTTLTVD
jgi:hypothetical protein